jgi:hypothetical protein
MIQPGLKQGASTIYQNAELNLHSCFIVSRGKCD